MTMAKNNIMLKHANESLALKVQQKNEWKELLKNQNKKLLENENVVGIAERFYQERDDHNKRFERAKKEMIERQQKELEEAKKIQQLDKSNDEYEK